MGQVGGESVTFGLARFWPTVRHQRESGRCSTPRPSPPDRLGATCRGTCATPSG